MSEARDDDAVGFIADAVGELTVSVHGGRKCRL
jgi:hypothetical protein